MRPARVVARAVLIAVLASVAVPGPVGSHSSSPAQTIDAIAFQPVGINPGTSVTPLTADRSQRSGGNLEPDGVMVEPDLWLGAPMDRPSVQQPAANLLTILTWIYDPNVSWYGPGFYGNRTACGVALTETTLGVANRTLPCGTRVTFKNPMNGRSITVPVIDRGPYVAGRQWDLTGGTCLAIAHCWTGAIEWRFA